MTKIMLRPQSIAHMVEHIESQHECTEDIEGFKPPHGWHTIDVGNGYGEVDPGCLGTWLRLFNMYAENRSGRVYWKDVPYFNREKREISATFCIAP